MRNLSILIAVLCTWGAAAPLGARQAPSAQPGVFVISPNKCDNARVAELNEWMRTSFAPILNDLVREGRLVGWGVLNHAWGDEWNWVLYYTARDIATFHAAFRSTSAV